MKTTTVVSGESSVIDFLLVLAASAVSQELGTVGCHWEFIDNTCYLADVKPRANEQNMFT